MNLQRAGIATILLGMLLLVVSLFWTSVVPDRAVWSHEKAVEYQNVSAQLHDDSFNPKLPPEQLAASREDFEMMQKQLDRARAVKHVTPFYLRVVGIAACVVGVGLIMAQNSAN